MDDVDALPESGSPARVPWWGGRGVAATLMLLSLLPLLFSVVEVAPGWLPVGDDATITMRGRDVFSDDMPLLGMPSAVGEQTGRAVHHPGPLGLWWVGAWVRSLGVDQAPLLAAAAAWGVASVVLLWLARRIGGTGLLSLAAVLTATTTWSLRGEVPVTPFNAHLIVVPVAAYVLGLVAWYRGIRGAGIAAVLLGSWAAQAHLTAAGPVVSAGGVVALAAVVRHVRHPDRRRPRVGASVLGVVVLLAAWSGPLVDIVTNDGGNVRAVLAARSDLASEAIGVGTALDIVARAVAVPPVWASAGAHPAELVVPAGINQFATATIVVLLAVAGAIRHRRTHPTLGLAVCATLVAMGTGAVLAARFPSDYLSLLALHNHLWLWPLTALLWGAAALSVGLEIRDRVPGPAPRWAPSTIPVAAAVMLVTVGVASAGSPHRNLTLATPDYVRALGDGLVDDLDPRGTYRVTISGEFDRFFVEVGLLSYLEGEGLDVVGPERYRHAFGDDRVTPAKPLSGDLVVDLSWEREDLDAGSAATGSERLIAEHRPSDHLLVERREVEDALVRLLRGHSDELPLWDMGGTDDAEVLRWLREDLDALLLARLLPRWLSDAPETARYLDLQRKPVLHAATFLVTTGGEPARD